MLFVQVSTTFQPEDLRATIYLSIQKPTFIGIQVEISPRQNDEEQSTAAVDFLG